MTGVWRPSASLLVGSEPDVQHAPTVYVASSPLAESCTASSGRLFDPLNLDDGCRLAAAEGSLRSVIPSGANIYAESDSPSQRSLSSKIEAQSVSRIFGDPALSRHRRLHLEACRVPGAGAWLTAIPSSADSHVPSTGWPCSAASACLCGITIPPAACVSKFWTVCCGGDRVLRHNAVRNVVCSAIAEFTSVSLELEKPGLLLSLRPPDPGGTDLDLSSPPRPSPRLLGPRGVSTFAEGWDFSVSSLLRTSHLSSATPTVADVFHEVETRKRAFQDTASMVAARGATFYRFAPRHQSPDCTALQLVASPGDRACNLEAFSRVGQRVFWFGRRPGRPIWLVIYGRVSFLVSSWSLSVFDRWSCDTPLNVAVSSLP